MRSNLAFAGIFALLTASGVAIAQGLPLPGGSPPPAPPTAAAVPAGEARVINAPEVEVRCGPSDKYYATCTLYKGDKVVVVGEAVPGWLKIKPPPGSFSWIKGVFVERWEKYPQTGRVVTDPNIPVPVLAGSTTYKQEPTVEVAKVDRGTQVVILKTAQNDPNMYVDSGAYLMIAPTEQEVRYIPADAIANGTPNRVVQREAPAPPGLQQATGTAPTSKAQADQYLDAARRYYEQAARDSNLDPAQRQQAWTMLQTLNGAQGTAQAAAPPGHPSSVADAQPQAQLVSRNSQPAGPTTGQTLANYNTNPPATAAVAVPGANGQFQWSNWGILRKTSFPKDGQAVYVLQTNQGVPIVYAVPERGKTLDRYLGRMVALYGSVTYPASDHIPNYLMTVSYVAPPQEPH